MNKTSNRRIKYFACGEYGELEQRPHYHAIVFGLKPCESCWSCREKLIGRIPDNPTGDCLLIRENWKMGNVHIGNVEAASCFYVAGYMKKQQWIGKEAKKKYETTHREPPFNTQSIGLGEQYCLTHREYFEEKLGCTVNGVEVGLPKYYRSVLSKTEFTEKEQKEKLKQLNERSAKQSRERERELDALIRSNNPESMDLSYDVIMRDVKDRAAREHLLLKREKLIKESKTHGNANLRSL